MRIPALPVVRLCVALLLVLASTGCQSGSVSTRIADVAPADRVSRADALVAEAPRSGNVQQQRLLTAAMLYTSAQAYAKATATLNRIDASLLDRGLRGDFLVTATDAALGTGDINGAWLVVAPAPAGRYAFLDDLQPIDYARVAERRAVVLERRGQIADAIRERVVAGPQLPAEAARANTESLWALLLKVDHGTLRQLAGSSESVVSGWATLATTYRDSAESASLRSGRIEAWLQANPAHPAAASQPAAIARARGIDSRALEVQRMAVIIPQHGKLAAAGTALQRGILAAWFHAREAGASMPVLAFYDSSRTDFLATYDAAVSDGAQLVIGPLEKENLRLLQQREKLPVPTLALNYPDNNATPANMGYFGLAGEDEAEQIARGAMQANLGRAAILFPSADWGQRIARQIEQTLQQGGAHVQSKGSYQGNGDFNEAVRRLLDVGTSEQRHGRIEKLLGTRLAFQPRRRQDIDSLFIVANTTQATQIAPAVQYYYAGGLPTFATSHVNSQPGPTSANDLEGIRFVEMPWIIDAAHPLRIRVEETWKDIDERYFRLYALGIDALRVGQQLRGFTEDPGMRIEGTTGSLTMDAARHVHRELAWMVFRGGNAEQLDAGK